MVDYENPWIYDGKEFTSDHIGSHFGFVYRITNKETGRKYIGRKYFWSKRSLEIVVGEELRLKVTGKNTTEVVQILKGMYCSMVGSPFSGKFLLYTPQQESVTLRRQDNCF